MNKKQDLNEQAYIQDLRQKVKNAEGGVVKSYLDEIRVIKVTNG